MYLSTGIPSASTYPYVGAPQQCDIERSKRIVASIDGYTYLYKKKEAYLLKKVANGHVACSFVCTPEFFHYQGGILKYYSPEDVNHSVLMVGYATTRVITRL